MDNKRLLYVMSLFLAFIVLWNFVLVPNVYHAMGWETPIEKQHREQAEKAVAATQISTPATGASEVVVATSSTSPTTGVAGNVLAPGANVRVVATTQPQPVALGSFEDKNADYAIGLRLNPRGAGIDSVTLNAYKAAVGKPEPYVYQQPAPEFEDATRPLATGVVKLSVGGVTTTIDLSGVVWNHVESDDRTTAIYTVDVMAGADRLAEVRKTYSVEKKSEVSEGYEVRQTTDIVNKTNQPITASLEFNGPSTPPKELDRGYDRNYLGGYDKRGTVYVTHSALESFTDKHPSYDLSKADGEYPMLWAGVCSVYFNAFVKPEVPAGVRPTDHSIVSVNSKQLNSPSSDANHPHVIAMTFATSTMTIAPGATASVPLSLHFGPRMRSLLNADHYAAFPRGYNNSLVLTAGPCAFITFQWLVDILVGLLKMFHFVVRDWGIAIICLVLVVRLLLHPITKRSQISMAKLGKMGPEMERLKKKHGENKDELNRAMMEFYKNQGFSPFLGCLPMFLQMPIWIALYSALQSTFELRQAPFLHFFGVPLTWIKDLSQPDHLIPFSPEHHFTLLFIPVTGLNLMPFLLGVVFWIQMKYQPKPPPTTPEQAQQQKMMQWMTLLFPAFLYGGPSGLNLYILTSTAYGIIESKIIRDHIKQREAAENEGRVVIDAEIVTRGRGKAITPTSKTEAAAPAGCLGGFVASMQKKVAEIQKEADKKRR